MIIKKPWGNIISTIMLTYFFKTKTIVNTSESTCFALLWSRRLDIDDGFKCVRNRLFDVVLAFSSLLVSAMVLSTSVPISDSLRNCCSMSSVFLKTSSLFEMFLEGDLSTKAWLSNPALSTVDRLRSTTESSERNNSSSRDCFSSSEHLCGDFEPWFE